MHLLPNDKQMLVISRIALLLLMLFCACLIYREASCFTLYQASTQQHQQRQSYSGDHQDDTATKWFAAVMMSVCPAAV